MRIPAGTATPRRQSGLPRASMSRQVQQQRRGYAQAVLRALARSQRGRPIPQMQRVLREYTQEWRRHRSQWTSSRTRARAPLATWQAWSTGQICAWVGGANRGRCSLFRD
jgi:hypothetical protein